MKKTLTFVAGVLCGAVLFGGGAALASSGVLATLTRQVFYYNGDRISLEAYSIDGYNYIKLRDAAELFGVPIEYDEATDSVYLGEKPVQTVPTAPKIADGNAYARADFSTEANLAVFNEVYTREAYNAIRQSIVDRDVIVAGNDANGYNAAYGYAHFVDSTMTFGSTGRTYQAMNSVLGAMNGYYFYLLGSEPGLKDYYKYPGYAVCKPTVHGYFAEANRATDGFIAGLSGLSDKEKVKRICEYISDRIDYDYDPSGGINEMFTSAVPIKGNCGTYSSAFVYLGQRAGLNCLWEKDDDHGWNEVYVDGEWRTVDVGYYDTALTEAAVFPASIPHTDADPQKTNFVKELLVPGSTK